MHFIALALKDNLADYLFMLTENNRFRETRKAKGYTQNQIAEILGIKNSAVSKWECGRTVPDSEMLTFLADLYGVSIDYLLGRTSQQNLFDDARVPKTEVQTLYDKLTPVDKGRILGYMQSIIDSYGRD